LYTENVLKLYYTLYFNGLKYFGGLIWRVTLFKDRLVLAQTYRIAYFKLCRVCNLYMVIHRQEPRAFRLPRRLCRVSSFDAFEHCNSRRGNRSIHL